MLSAMQATDLLARCDSLVSLVRAAAPDGERDRRVAERVIDAARAAGLFHAIVPASLGALYFARRVRKGPEMKLLREHAPGIEELFPGWCASTPFATLRRRIAMLHALDLSDEIRAIRVPLAFLHGASDRVVPRGFFEELRRLRPDAEATLLEAAGHNLPLTHPEDVARYALGEL